MANDNEKVCCRCKTVKNKLCFWKKSAAKDGIQSYCKACEATAGSSDPTQRRIPDGVRKNKVKKNKMDKIEQYAKDNDVTIAQAMVHFM